MCWEIIQEYHVSLFKLWIESTSFIVPRSRWSQSQVGLEQCPFHSSAEGNKHHTMGVWKWHLHCHLELNVFLCTLSVTWSLLYLQLIAIEASTVLVSKGPPGFRGLHRAKACALQRPLPPGNTAAVVHFWQPFFAWPWGSPYCSLWFS